MASRQAAVTVPLQACSNDEHPGEYQQNTMVQYSTVEVTAERPKDHIIWSLCCFVYGNPFCLGLAALIFSIKARDRKVVGDLVGARHHASTALILNIVATILTTLLVCIAIIVPIALILQATRYSGYYNRYIPN